MRIDQRDLEKIVNEMMGGEPAMPGRLRLRKTSGWQGPKDGVTDSTYRHVTMLIPGAHTHQIQETTATTMVHNAEPTKDIPLPLRIDDGSAQTIPDIEIQADGTVRLQGLEPDQASMEFWRCVSTNHPERTKVYLEEMLALVRDAVANCGCAGQGCPCCEFLQAALERPMPTVLFYSDLFDTVDDTIPHQYAVHNDTAIDAGERTYVQWVNGDNRFIRGEERIPYEDIEAQLAP